MALKNKNTKAPKIHKYERRWTMMASWLSLTLFMTPLQSSENNAMFPRA